MKVAVSLIVLLLAVTNLVAQITSPPKGQSLDERAEVERLGPLRGGPEGNMLVLLDSAFKELGLASNAVKSDVELILLRNKIPFRFGLNLKQPGSLIMVEIKSIDSKVSSVYAVLASVEYKDWVTLDRTGFSTLASVWREEALFTIGKDRVAAYARSEVKDLMEHFCLDYLKANQK